MPASKRCNFFFPRNSISTGSMRFCWFQWSMKGKKLSTLNDNKREIGEIKKKKQELYLNYINPSIYTFEIIAYRSEQMTRKRTWNSVSKYQLVFINREILKQNVNFEFLIQNRIISFIDEIPCLHFVRKDSESTVTVVAFRTSSVFEITYSSFDQFLIRCLHAFKISRKKKKKFT